MKSPSALWIRRLAKPLEKNIIKGIIIQKGQRVTSAVRYDHFSFFYMFILLVSTCSSQNLSFTRLFKVEAPVNRKFFCRFWALTRTPTAAIIYTLIHLNLQHLQFAQFLFCLSMFLRKTTIICQVYVTLFLVPFLDMLSSIPGVLSVYSSLVLNHISAFLSILEGMLRKPWLRLLLAHFEKHENLNKNAFLVKLRYTKKNCVKLFKHTALFHPVPRVQFAYVIKASNLHYVFN